MEALLAQWVAVVEEGGLEFGAVKGEVCSVWF